MGQGREQETRAVLERIYRRDPVRFRKLIVWVNKGNRTGWSESLMLRALLRLDEQEAAGTPVRDWWPYLTETMRWLRVRDQEKESAEYKKGDANSVKSIIKAIFKDIV